jgi:ATP-dependent DNA helicase RecG
MQDFRDKKYDILVSTSVVEVGVDIPNASVMVIEGAERFGLAQLYQFRGRVGRGAHQSYCFLFAESSSPATSQRLKAVVAAQSGFELAEKDLELRGPGEFWGAQQWGLPDLAMASLADRELIKSCRSEAEKILAKDPELKNFPSLKEKLSAFKSIVHLE